MDSTNRKWQREENLTDRPIEEKTLHEGFLENVKTHSDKTALICGGERYTYKMTYDRACAFAEALMQSGLKSGDTAAVSLPRSIDMVCAVLGVLMAGGVYVPVSHAQPSERRIRIYDKADIRYCITSKTVSFAEIRTVKNIFAEDVTSASEGFAPLEASPESSAYIIFTSGSTGEPKGVEIAHASAWNTIKDITDRMQLSGSDTCINVSALDFDLSVFDIFGLLACGGSIVLLTDDTYKDPAVWKKLITENKVTFWNSVPALFEMLMLSLDGQDDIGSLKNVLLSGDHVMPKLFSMLREKNKDCRFTALGGATEASIWSNFYTVSGSEDANTNFPYGKPLANQQFRIIKDGKDAEDGQTGELWIGGKGLAKGYIGDREKTEKAFVFDEDGKRWYRTGDTGYYREDGNIIFVGRTDDQVKVNGFRIELGEIENRLNSLDGIARTVALVDKDSDSKKICAAIEPALIRRDALPSPVTEVTAENGETPYDAVIYGFMRKVIESVGEESMTDEMRPVMELWKSKLSGLCDMSSDDVKAAVFGNALDKKVSLMADIFTGRRQPIELLNDDTLAPERLTAMLDLDADLEAMARHIAESKKTDVIAFVSCREGILAAKLLEKLTKQASVRRILYFENGTAMLSAAKNALQSFGIETAYINTDSRTLNCGYAACADCVISLNGLHLFENITSGLDWIKLIMKKDSGLFITEPAHLSAAGYISAAVIEQGFERYTDMRKGLCKPMLTPDEWNSELTAAGFEDITASPCKCGDMFMYSGVFRENSYMGLDELKKQCAEKLVYYMVPDSFAYCIGFPLTSNGKIDRKALMRMFSETSQHSGTSPEGDTEKALAGIWKEILGCEEVFREDNFFETGGDSLLSTRLISAVRARFGAECSMKEIFDSPVLSDMAEVIAGKSTDDDFEEGEL